MWQHSVMFFYLSCFKILLDNFTPFDIRRPTITLNIEIYCIIKIIQEVNTRVCVVHAACFLTPHVAVSWLAHPAQGSTTVVSPQPLPGLQGVADRHNV